jgi:hypothetical protein
MEKLGVRMLIWVTQIKCLIFITEYHKVFIVREFRNEWNGPKIIDESRKLVDEWVHKLYWRYKYIFRIYCIKLGYIFINRKRIIIINYMTVPITDTGGLVEYTKVSERRILKEFGKMAP